MFKNLKRICGLVPQIGWKIFVFLFYRLVHNALLLCLRAVDKGFRQESWYRGAWGIAACYKRVHGINYLKRM
jgi:hypothetical protein